MSERQIVQMREYQTVEISDVELTWRDERVLRRVLAGQADGKQLDVRQLPGRVEVKSSYWVGVARFEQFEVHVQPKLVGSEDALIRMLDFASDAFDLRRFDVLRTYKTEDDASLIDLFALMLADASEQLIRQGLLADYVEHEDLLPAVRGRILADRQVLKRFGVVDRVYCRYDERVQNVAENQLLLRGLEEAYKLMRRPFLKSRLRRLMRTVQEVCDLDGFDRDAARRLQYHRLNEHYRNAHGLTWIILEASGLDSFYDSGGTHGVSFFINMIALFEKFIERLTKYIFPNDTHWVGTQFRDRTIIRHAQTHETYREIRPDVLLRNRANNRTLPIDAKYKLYDDKKIATADAYQLFFYANAYNLRDDPAALLLFPRNGGHQIEHLTAHEVTGRKMGNLVAAGLDVEIVLDAVEQGQPLTEIHQAFSKADARVAPPPPKQTPIEELLDLCLPEEEEVLRACDTLALPLPLLGFELKVGRAVAAQFSLAWPHLKLAVADREQPGAPGDWTLATYETVIELLQQRHKT